MNRKIVSLLTALLLCLNFFPVQALAAEETPGQINNHRPRAMSTTETAIKLTLMERIHRITLLPFCFVQV